MESGSENELDELIFFESQILTVSNFGAALGGVLSAA